MVTNSTRELLGIFVLSVLCAFLLLKANFFRWLSSWWETFPAYLYLSPFLKFFFLLSDSINTHCEKKPERNIAIMQVITISTENRMLLQVHFSSFISSVFTLPTTPMLT